MASKPRSKKPSSKKTYKKYYRKSKKSIINRPFPMKNVVKMKFVDLSTVTYDFNTAGGIASRLQYRANSIFDPTFTGGATRKPNGYNQWLPIYNRYKVLKSRAVCRLTNINYPNVNNVPSCPFVMSARCTDDAVITNTLLSMLEEQKDSYKYIPMIQQTTTTNSTQQLLQRIISVSTGFNASKNQNKDQDGLNSLMNASPSISPLFSFQFQPAGTLPVGGLTSIVTFDVVVEIVYTVQLYDIKDLGPSN